MLLYYITERRQFRGDQREQRRLLLAKIAEAARCGVDYIQVREKDLSARELETLARAAVQVVRDNCSAERHSSRLLINSRIDVAIAAAADGVHLRSDDIAASDARAIFATAEQRRREHSGQPPIIGVSCHSLQAVDLAESHGANFVVYGPIFEKSETTQGHGLAALRALCRRRVAPAETHPENTPHGFMPVLALGGVTLENAQRCIQAGAAGVAGIRLFQENEIEDVVRRLRPLG